MRRRSLGRSRGTLLIFLSEVRARHDKMVELVETMLKLHKGLPRDTSHISERCQGAA